MTRMSESTQSRIRSFAKVVVFTTLVVTLVAVAGAVMKPKRDGAAAGGSWASFLSQPRDSLDVLAFGTSHAFTSFDPSSVWRAKGIPSFVLAGPTQHLNTTRYFIDEALHTQKPKVVVLEMVAFSYPPNRFNRNFHLVNVGYMPMSLNRLKASVFATPWGEHTGVLVDLWTYHGRWAELTPADYNFSTKNEGHEFLRGWIPLVGVSKKVPSEPVKRPKPAANAPLPATYAANLESLRAIARTCESRDIELLLMLAPTGPPAQYSNALDAGARLLSAEFDNVHVLDLSQPGAVPDLSYETDFFDGGHLTAVGAEKSSKVLAGYLAEKLDLPDRSGDPAYSSWSRDVQTRDEYVADLVRNAKAKKKK